MKKIIISLLMVLPMMASAQDNTWERVEVAPVDATNPNARYLEPNAVPEVDGKVCWTVTIPAPDKTAQQIYDILLAQMNKMAKEPNQMENSAVALQDAHTHQLGAVFHEWLVFKSASLSLDRTQLNFRLLADCYDGKAEVKMTYVSYDYDTARKPFHYTAEEWITDKYCVNKKHTRLLPVSGKFRRKTIDRKDFIFNKFNTLLNEK